MIDFYIKSFDVQNKTKQHKSDKSKKKKKKKWKKKLKGDGIYDKTIVEGNTLVLPCVLGTAGAVIGEPVDCTLSAA